MRLFGSFRDDRALLRKSAAFASSLMQEPSDAEVAWLSNVATRGDDDHARWELRYLRRALGILVAQRDALNDRTPSEALRALLHRMSKDHNVDRALRELAARQFNARINAYRDAYMSRGLGTAALRVAQNLLAFSGGPIRADDPAVVRGSALVTQYVAGAGEALRESFGVVPPADFDADAAVQAER